MTEQADVLFLGHLDVVSTKRPSTGDPVVGLVMAQRIHVLGNREEMEQFFVTVRNAADAAWPVHELSGDRCAGTCIHDDPATCEANAVALCRCPDGGCSIHPVHPLPKRLEAAE